MTLKNQLLRDIRIAFGQVQTTYQNISVTKELVKNTDEAIDLTHERYSQLIPIRNLSIALRSLRGAKSLLSAALA